MTVRGVELKDRTSMLSLLLAGATASGTAIGARGPARVRAKLDSETEMWAPLPEETEQRDGMWALACRSLARLAQLEDPERRTHATAVRRRLLTAHERLDPAAFAKLWNSMIDAGDPGLEILHAYTVKENLRQLLALSGTNPERAIIRARLWRQYEQAAASPSPGVHRFAATIEAWWPAIEAAITTDHSNARSEGYNRLAKHQSRNAFVYRNVHTTAALYAGPALVNTPTSLSREVPRQVSMSHHACRPSRKGNNLLNHSEGDQLA